MLWFFLLFVLYFQIQILPNLILFLKTDFISLHQKAIYALVKCIKNFIKLLHENLQKLKSYLVNDAVFTQNELTGELTSICKQQSLGCYACESTVTVGSKEIYWELTVASYAGTILYWTLLSSGKQQAMHKCKWYDGMRMSFPATDRELTISGLGCC